MENKNESQSWKNFQGIENTDEVLIKKAKALAPFLVIICHRITEDVLQQLRELKEKNKTIEVDEQKTDETFFEFLFFFVHLIDRISFSYFDIKRRNIFMDVLFVELREELSRFQEGGIESLQFREFLNQNYNRKQEEYSKYSKWFPEKNEGTKDTLFWEFGKKIAKILSAEMDIFVIMIVQMLSVEFLKVMDLPSLLTGQRNNCPYCGAKLKKVINFCTQCSKKI